MNYVGEIAALLTALCWAITSIIFTDTSRKIGSLSVNVLRLVFAFLYLTLLIIILGKNIDLSSNQYILLIVSGFVGLVFGDSFLYLSYKKVGPRIGMLMMSLAPAITTFLGYILLNELLSIQALIGISFTISGVALVIIQKKEKHLNIDNKNMIIGVLCGLMAAIGQGTGLVITKLAFLEGELDSFVANYFRIISALILITPITFFTKDFINPIKVIKTNKKVILIVCIGALIGPFLGISLSLFAISNTKIGIATALMATVPVMLLPIVKIYYKEKLSVKSVLGAIIAVLGIFILFLR